MWRHVPVLIAGGASQWPAVRDVASARAWRRTDRFRERFGTVPVTVGAIPYAQQVGALNATRWLCYRTGRSGVMQWVMRFA